MAHSPSDQPPAGGSPDLRRSVGEATERIHEIINTAERVASEIRADAEAEARTYLDQRRREADRAAEERNSALDQLTRSLADTAEEFKHQAERMLAELDKSIVEARAGMYRQGALSALDDEPAAAPPAPREEETPEPEPLSMDREPFSVESLSRETRTPKPLGLEPLPPLESQDDPFELPPLDPQEIQRDRPSPAPDRPAPAAVSAYPGRGDRSRDADSPQAGGDRASEALLRATQLAVTGKDRDEIANVLRSDFPGVETDSLLDEILG